MAEVVLDGITHRYGDGDEDAALDGIDLTWEHGGAYALLGPSGCGKTTMLDIISGLLVPSEGRVLFDGRDVTRVSTVERNIAQVFQFPVLYDTMTVEQNLMFPLRNRGIDKIEARRRAAEICELLELDDVRTRRAKGLTADAKQLVSLGRALVRSDVSAILFDEPLTVIDPQKKWGIRQALKRVHAELNHTLVYVTHDQTEALTFADEVVVMTAGHVVQKGTPEALFERPSHRFVGDFIGSPGMNFLPARASLHDSDDRGDRAVTVSIGDLPVLELPQAVAIERGIDFLRTEMNELGELSVGIRPEFVHCSAEPGEGGIDGVVRRRTDLGATVVVDIDTPFGPVLAKTPTSPAVEGERCLIGFDADRLILFARDEAVDAATPTPATATNGTS